MDDATRTRLAQEGTVELIVRVRPQAQNTCLKGRRADGVWKVDVAAPPEDGAANELLRRFLAAECRTPLSGVQILSGMTSREKRVRIIARP